MVNSMSKKTIMTLIAMTLILFVLIKVIIAQLCAPTPSKTVANTISNVISTPTVPSVPSKPDPLSWEPVLSQLLAFFSKACHR